MIRPTGIIVVLLLLLAITTSSSSSAIASDKNHSIKNKLKGVRQLQQNEVKTISNEQSPTSSSSPLPERRLVSFWNMLFLVNVNDICPPGPKRKSCLDAKKTHHQSGGGGSSGGSGSGSGGSGSDGSGSGSGGSSSGGGSSGSSSSSGSGSYSEGGDSGSNGYNSGGSDGDGSYSGGSGSYSNGGEGGDEESFYAANGGENAVSNEKSPMDIKSPITITMLVVAAAALTLAVAAVATSQRQTHSPSHALKGSVSRRIALFSSLAGTNNIKDSRPPRRIELTMAQDDYGKQNPSLKESLV